MGAPHSDLHRLTELFFLMRQNTLLRIRAHMTRSFCSCRCMWRWCSTTGKRMYLESGGRGSVSGTSVQPREPPTNPQLPASTQTVNLLTHAAKKALVLHRWHWKAVAPFPNPGFQPPRPCESLTEIVFLVCFTSRHPEGMLLMLLPEFFLRYIICRLPTTNQI